MELQNVNNISIAAKKIVPDIDVPAIYVSTKYYYQLIVNGKQLLPVLAENKGISELHSNYLSS